jgi:hypothetical protein
MGARGRCGGGEHLGFEEMEGERGTVEGDALAGAIAATFYDDEEWLIEDCEGDLVHSKGRSWWREQRVLRSMRVLLACL